MQQRLYRFWKRSVCGIRRIQHHISGVAVRRRDPRLQVMTNWVFDPLPPTMTARDASDRLALREFALDATLSGRPRISGHGSGVFPFVSKAVEQLPGRTATV